MENVGGVKAPEVLAGKAYGTGQDVWSFGATLFELACKKMPFHNVNEAYKCKFRSGYCLTVFALYVIHRVSRRSSIWLSDSKSYHRN